MIKQISTYLNISKKNLKKQGVFDAILGMDTKLFVDPYLLKNCKIPEFVHSYSKVQNFFGKILKLLSQSLQEGDIFWKQADKLLTFREPAYLCIGYSADSSNGSSIGRNLRQEILRASKKILDAGYNDPEIFELVGLFQDGMGPDRISDLTCHIIADDIANYTENFITKNNIPKVMTVDTIVKDKKYKSLRYVKDNQPKQLMLLPIKIMRDLPVALDWSDMDRIILENDQTRARVNVIIGETWKQASRVKKDDLKKVLFEYPEILADLIKKYKTRDEEAYNFEIDRASQILWAQEGLKIALENPLDLDIKEYNEEKFLFETVLKICQKFKDLVENNKLSDLLFYDNKHRPESFAQLLIYAVADSYCSARNIDVSREVNSGRGPVDFKFSKDYQTRVLLEIKLSSNKKILDGFNKQLKAYESAEKTENSIYMIIIVSDKHENNVREFVDYYDSVKQDLKGIHDIIIVDATNKPSASKL